MIALPSNAVEYPREQAIEERGKSVLGLHAEIQQCCSHMSRGKFRLVRQDIYKFI